ncbi:MAG TPA: c-type cytochrome [Rubrivivax sp.]|nr:c-type cytochrome [Burkholderiales bacterium]HNT39033.1 c-type cytochrome [Rubrivivax sp.]
MSENPAEAQSHHEGPIKTPKQLIWTVVGSFLVPVIVIMMLTRCVDQQERTGAGSTSMSAEATAQRIQPVGMVELHDASAPKVVHTGEQVYQGQCAACHGTGVAGAPKLGDAAAWSPRLAGGYEVLLQSALKGKGAMSPQGGGQYSDYEIGRAVVYMANEGGGKFAEPAAPEPAEAASAPG